MGGAGGMKRREEEEEVGREYLVVDGGSG